jgi:hypothetical protein
LSLTPHLLSISLISKHFLIFGIKISSKILINKEFHYLCHPKIWECSFMYWNELAGIAQLVEQLICNQQVAGSSPISGSKMFRADGRVVKGDRL